MEDGDEEELVKRLEWKINMENGRLRWRRVSGEIRMWDRDGEEKMKMKKS